jgi:hypothetical protein
LLTHLAPYVTAPSVLSSDVVPPIAVAVDSLTRLLSDIGVQELNIEVSEAFGISLSKVQAQYFESSDEGEVDHMLTEERDCLWEELRHQEEWAVAARHEYS